MEEQLLVTVIQSAMEWEKPDENLSRFEKLISKAGETDIIVLPEMFSTGFSMRPELFAEKWGGRAFRWMQQTATERGSVITGSIMTEENGRYYNRLVWMEPGGSFELYDKKHLFRFAQENEHYESGSKRLITSIKGWRICPLICYDLRFPVWSRNSYKEGEYGYDLLIYVANWPGARINAWKTLLTARAIENLSYTCGVNRIGIDGKGVEHNGVSMVADPSGNVIWEAGSDTESVETVVLPAAILKNARKRMKAGEDWDSFTIDPSPE